MHVHEGLSTRNQSESRCVVHTFHFCCWAVVTPRHPHPLALKATLSFSNMRCAGCGTRDWKQAGIQRWACHCEVDGGDWAEFEECDYSLCSNCIASARKCSLCALQLTNLFSAALPLMCDPSFVEQRLPRLPIGELVPEMNKLGTFEMPRGAGEKPICTLLSLWLLSCLIPAFEQASTV